jgi:hypothetical protein
MLPIRAPLQLDVQLWAHPDLQPTMRPPLLSPACLPCRLAASAVHWATSVSQYGGRSPSLTSEAEEVRDDKED